MVLSRRVTVARARPLASRSLAKPSMSARRTANRATGRVRHQLANWRRSRAYASRVRPRYPARNPARANRSASVKTGWIVASAVDGAAVIIGHLPDEPTPGKLGQQRAPAIKRKPTVSSAHRSRQVTISSSHGRDRSHRNCSRSLPNMYFINLGADSVRFAHIGQFSREVRKGPPTTNQAQNHGRPPSSFGVGT
jgi:hypothetical protein